MGERSLVRTDCTSCGSITTPSWAKAPATIAICRGDTRVSYWPIEVVATCASSISLPSEEGVTDSGISSRCTKPKPAAVSRSCSSPRAAPGSVEEGCHDWRGASASVDSSSGPQGSGPPPAGLFICAEEFGRSYTPGPGITDSAVYSPDSGAAEATGSLKAEPGGYRSPPMARLV